LPVTKDYIQNRLNRIEFSSAIRNYLRNNLNRMVNRILIMMQVVIGK